MGTDTGLGLPDAIERYAEYASGRLPRFSFDAVRLTLSLLDFVPQPSCRSVFAHFWNSNGCSLAPAWSDLESLKTAPYHLTPGTEAIRRFVNYQTGLATTCKPPPIALTLDYYAAALIMLVRAATETPPYAGA